MTAKVSDLARFAGMARSYRYLQADRRNCPQFAARQRGVWTTGISYKELLHATGNWDIAKKCRLPGKGKAAFLSSEQPSSKQPCP